MASTDFCDNADVYAQCIIIVTTYVNEIVDTVL